MSEAKKYDRSYKEQSVKPALEIGVKRASEELKVQYGTAIRMGAGGKERRLGHRGANPRKRNEPGGGDPSAAKRGKAAEQGKQAASGGERLSEWGAIFDCYDLTAIGLSMDGNMIY